MTTREDLYRLVDEIPERELQAARRYLEYLREMGDPLIQALVEAPFDDEPESEEEKKAVKEAYKDLSDGNIVSSDTIRDEIY